MSLGNAELRDRFSTLTTPLLDACAVIDAAAGIARRERAQADRVRKGVSLRQQFRFPEYLARRVEKPDYTFREHLASLGAAVEV